MFATFWWTQCFTATLSLDNLSNAVISVYAFSNSFLKMDGSYRRASGLEIDICRSSDETVDRQEALWRPGRLGSIGIDGVSKNSSTPRSSWIGSMLMLQSSCCFFLLFSLCAVREQYPGTVVDDRDTLMKLLTCDGNFGKQKRRSSRLAKKIFNLTPKDTFEFAFASNTAGYYFFQIRFFQMRAKRF